MGVQYNYVYLKSYISNDLEIHDTCLYLDLMEQDFLKRENSRDSSYKVHSYQNIVFILGKIRLLLDAVS